MASKEDAVTIAPTTDNAYCLADDLSTELWMRIIAVADGESLMNLSRVSRRFRALTESPSVWQNAVRRWYVRHHLRPLPLPLYYNFGQEYDKPHLQPPDNATCVECWRDLCEHVKWLPTPRDMLFSFYEELYRGPAHVRNQMTLLLEPNADSNFSIAKVLSSLEGGIFANDALVVHGDGDATFNHCLNPIDFDALKSLLPVLKRLLYELNCFLDGTYPDENLVYRDICKEWQGLLQEHPYLNASLRRYVACLFPSDVALSEQLPRRDAHLNSEFTYDIVLDAYGIGTNEGVVENEDYRLREMHRQARIPVEVWHSLLAKPLVVFLRNFLSKHLIIATNASKISPHNIDWRRLCHLLHTVEVAHEKVRNDRPLVCATCGRRRRFHATLGDALREDDRFELSTMPSSPRDIIPIIFHGSIDNSAPSETSQELPIQCTRANVALFGNTMWRIFQRGEALINIHPTGNDVNVHDERLAILLGRPQLNPVAEEEVAAALVVGVVENLLDDDNNGDAQNDDNEGHDDADIRQERRVNGDDDMALTAESKFEDDFNAKKAFHPSLQALLYWDAPKGSLRHMHVTNPIWLTNKAQSTVLVEVVLSHRIVLDHGASVAVQYMTAMPPSLSNVGDGLRDGVSMSQNMTNYLQSRFNPSEFPSTSQETAVCACVAKNCKHRKKRLPLFILCTPPNASSNSTQDLDTPLPVRLINRQYLSPRLSLLSRPHVYWNRLDVYASKLGKSLLLSNDTAANDKQVDTEDTTTGRKAFVQLRRLVATMMNARMLNIYDDNESTLATNDAMSVQSLLSSMWLSNNTEQFSGGGGNRGTRTHFTKMIPKPTFEVRTLRSLPLLYRPNCLETSSVALRILYTLPSAQDIALRLLMTPDDENDLVEQLSSTRATTPRQVNDFFSSSVCIFRYLDDTDKSSSRILTDARRQCLGSRTYRFLVQLMQSMSPGGALEHDGKWLVLPLLHVLLKWTHPHWMNMLWMMEDNTLPIWLSHLTSQLCDALRPMRTSMFQSNDTTPIAEFDEESMDLLLLACDFLETSVQCWFRITYAKHIDYVVDLLSTLFDLLSNIMSKEDVVARHYDHHKQQQRPYDAYLPIWTARLLTRLMDVSTNVLAYIDSHNNRQEQFASQRLIDIILDHLRRHHLNDQCVMRLSILSKSLYTSSNDNGDETDPRRTDDPIYVHQMTNAHSTMHHLTKRVLSQCMRLAPTSTSRVLLEGFDKCHNDVSGMNDDAIVKNDLKPFVPVFLQTHATFRRMYCQTRQFDNIAQFNANEEDAEIALYHQYLTFGMDCVAAMGSPQFAFWLLDDANAWRNIILVRRALDPFLSEFPHHGSAHTWMVYLHALALHVIAGVQECVRGMNVSSNNDTTSTHSSFAALSLVRLERIAEFADVLRSLYTGCGREGCRLDLFAINPYKSIFGIVFEALGSLERLCPSLERPARLHEMSETWCYEWTAEKARVTLQQHYAPSNPGAWSVEYGRNRACTVCGRLDTSLGCCHPLGVLRVSDLIPLIETSSSSTTSSSRDTRDANDDVSIVDVESCDMPPFVQWMGEDGLMCRVTNARVSAFWVEAPNAPWLTHGKWRCDIMRPGRMDDGNFELSIVSSRLISDAPLAGNDDDTTERCLRTQVAVHSVSWLPGSDLLLGLTRTSAPYMRYIDISNATGDASAIILPAITSDNEIVLPRVDDFAPNTWVYALNPASDDVDLFGEITVLFDLDERLVHFVQYTSHVPLVVSIKLDMLPAFDNNSGVKLELSQQFSTNSLCVNVGQRPFINLPVAEAFRPLMEYTDQ